MDMANLAGLERLIPSWIGHPSTGDRSGGDLARPDINKMLQEWSGSRGPTYDT
jgi:hypothetical protein